MINLHYIGVMPLCFADSKINNLRENEKLYRSFTLEDSAVGCKVTFPSSLSSKANIEAFSVYNFTFTEGKG